MASHSHTLADDAWYEALISAEHVRRKAEAVHTRRAVAATMPSKGYSSADLRNMIHMRMRWATNPFPFFEAHKDHTDKVHVFLVKGGESVVLTDDFAMFPSDALITQLRVLVG